MNDELKQAKLMTIVHTNEDPFGLIEMVFWYGWKARIAFSTVLGPRHMAIGLAYLNLSF